MLWLIACPGAGCRHGEETRVSGEIWKHAGLVMLGHERKMGGLLTILGPVVCELIKGEEGSVRDGCCLCNADAAAMQLGKLLWLPKMKGLKKRDDGESTRSCCCMFGITTL